MTTLTKLTAERDTLKDQIFNSKQDHELCEPFNMEEALEKLQELNSSIAYFNNNNINALY